MAENQGGDILHFWIKGTVGVPTLYMESAPGVPKFQKYVFVRYFSSLRQVIVQGEINILPGG